uniref:Uncharacterized protein n=1 Tax=Anopheles dirus TaxID=7168 RepID=A0A182N9Z1_9DIPT
MASSQDSNSTRRLQRLMDDLHQEADAEWNQMGVEGPDGSFEIRWPTLQSGNDISSDGLGGGDDGNDAVNSSGNFVNNSGNGDGIAFDNLSDDHEDNERVDKLSQEDSLRYMAILGNMSRSLVNLMLAILRKKFNAPHLPKYARTLLKTPTHVGTELTPIAGGQFWYQGVEMVLTKYCENVIPEVDTFSLQVSIDGLPLFKSVAVQLWPILIKVEELPHAAVMLVVFEVNDLQQRGLQFGDKVVRLVLRALIADSPARAFALATVSFGAKHGCLKCTGVGEYVENKVIFESVHAELRTDAGFRSRIDKDHHKEWKTPLEDLHNFNLIDDVVVAERLHLIDLGVTKKLLGGLFKHEFNQFRRWSPQEKESVSNFLIKTPLPSEVHRRMRSLKCVNFGKGTELRSFLHYLSPFCHQDTNNSL